MIEQDNLKEKQLKALCRELGIERVNELPDDFTPS
jgi:hypothetical protein